MNSYFFVPGSKLDKLKAVVSLNVSEIIIDLEDALKESEQLSILKALENREEYSEYYLRIPLVKGGTNEIDTRLLEQLRQIGYRKFVFPKIGSLADFQKVVSAIPESDIHIILLIETPRLFLEAKDLLLTYKNLISGIGLGSHDLMSATGGVHDLENLYYARQHVLYLARMINAVAIDIASMELRDKALLTNEILDGFRKGYEAKFFIHPWQIDVLRSINFYSKEEYDWAKSIIAELNKTGKKEEFEPTVINGQVIERPHLNRAQQIIKYYRNES